MKENLAYIGMGSSIEPKRNLALALKMLMRELDVRAISRVYETPAIDRPKDPDFFNCAAQVLTILEPAALKIGVLRPIEERLGRERNDDKFAPRRIDLDLVLYGGRVSQPGEPIFPDPDIRTRPFLAASLLDLDPALVLPDTAQSVASLFEEDVLKAIRVCEAVSYEMTSLIEERK